MTDSDKRQKLRYFFKEWVLPVIIALIIVLFLNKYVFILVTVPTGSMEDTIIPVSYTHLDVYKRQCQGKTCGHLIMREIANATGQNIKDIKFQTNRPPVVGVKLGLIAEEGRNEE